MVQETRKTNGLSLDYIFHPGDTLMEILEDRNMTQKELAMRTGVTQKHVSTIVAGKKPISVNFARKLEYALGIDAQFWINLQTNYDCEIAEYEDANNISKAEIKIVENFRPIISDWSERGWITANCTKIEQVMKMRFLLNVSNLCDIPKVCEAAAFRIQSNVTVDPYVIFAWQKMCEMQIDTEKVENELDIELLKKRVPDIKKTMFCDADTMRKQLKKIFAECGIAFEIVKNYKGAPVQGYINRINNRLVLCVTLRGKFADRFWFTVFHEIGHIINGDIEKVFIDINSINNVQETKADNYAKNTLLDSKQYSKFIASDNVYSYSSVKRLAEDCGVQPFVVIGRMMNDGIVDWSDYQDYRVKYEWRQE